MTRHYLFLHLGSRNWNGTEAHWSWKRGGCLQNWYEEWQNWYGIVHAHSWNLSVYESVSSSWDEACGSLVGGASVDGASVGGAEVGGAEVDGAEVGGAFNGGSVRSGSDN